MTMLRTWIVIAILFVLTLLGTAALMRWGNEIARHFHEEVFKLLANLVITAGIGGVATLALSEISAARERREATRALARSTLKDIIDSYNDVKRIRRELRAEAVRPDYKNSKAHVLEKPYGDLMRELNAAQLRLESHLRLVEGNAAQYRGAARLQQRLGDAESYVGALVSEWEDRLGHFAAVPAQNLLADFAVLRCFVSHAKQSFKPGFSAPISDVFSILGKSAGM